MHNWYEVLELFKLREFRNTILYFLLTGLTCPSFKSFGYFFYMDVVGLSMFTYSMLGVLGFGALFIGT